MSARRAASGNGSLLWMQGLACGGVLAFAPAMALVLGVLFWPLALAIAIDRAPGRPMARAVALCAAAASVAPVHAAWSGGLGLRSGLALVSDVHVLAASWCAAAGGWGLSALAPIAARAVLDATNAARSARLRAERARLRATWRFDEPASDPSG